MADLSERQGAVIIGFIWAFTIIAAVTAGLRLYHITNYGMGKQDWILSKDEFADVLKWDYFSR
ncbi:hypothetical protein VSDG_06724 [Cytospora chrysosperma]|uniref:Uncharacterized protein n=1 Tax=Cytospora chrysosperma TaxID=252740 RepID=A0A423VNA7_CYTCH|nr:hypothetical protein VSDG_06724 [Valsa sordida]